MNFTEAERGRMPPTVLPPDREALPRGGTYPLAYPQTFGSQQGLTARAHSQKFDDALRYSQQDATRMLFDPVIRPCINIRAFTVSLLPWTIKPEEETDPRQKADAALVTKLIKRTPRLVESLRWLNYDGVWSGKSGLFIRYGWGPEGKYWQPTGTRPILGDKLAYKWDDTVGISINLLDAKGMKTDFLDKTPVVWLSPEERECLVVHRQFAEDSPYLDYMSSGAIHGRGLRHGLYWIWKMKMDVWKMGIDFLQWFARGLMVYYFDSGNDEHRKQVEAWVKTASGDNAMLFPVLPLKKGQVPSIKSPIERFEVSTASPAFLQSLVEHYFDDLLKFNILHQIGTTSSMPTGLGSGQSEAHEHTFDAVVKMDAICLQETLTQDLVLKIYHANCPGRPPGRWEFSIDTPNVQQALDTAQAIVNMGGSVAQEPLEEAGGIPKAKNGDTILGGPQANQPVAVGSTPEDTPMVSADASGQQPVG